MSDILERARQAQRDQAHGTTLNIRLDFLQDIIAEIERLQQLVGPGTLTSIKDIKVRHQLKEDPS